PVELVRDGGPVLGADVGVELQGELGDEVVHRRGVGAHPQLQQGQGEGLGGGQPAQVEQAVPVGGVDLGEVLDVADAVLEADEVLVPLGQPGDRGGGVDGVGPVVGDDPEVGGRTHGRGV